MKKRAMLLVFATLLCASCSKNTKPDSQSTPLSSSASSIVEVKDYSLQTALDKVGSNYTLQGQNYDGDIIKTVITDVSTGFVLQSQVIGTMYVDSDKKTYHDYTYYKDDNSMEITGRKDVTKEEFDNSRKFSSLIDASLFVQSSDDKSVFHCADEKQEQKFLDFVSHPLSMFLGFGDMGFDIHLTDDNSIEKIVVLDKDIKDNVFLSVSFDNIGTTTDDVITTFLQDPTNLPSPSIGDLVQVDRNGVSLYEGETHNLTGVVSSIIGENATSAAIKDEFGSAIYIPEAEKLDAWNTYYKSVTLDGTIKSINGAVSLSNIDNVIVGEDEEVEPFEVDSGTYNDELLLNGAAFSGAAINTTLNYVGGEISYEGAFELNFKYNDGLPVTLKFTEDASEDLRSTFEDFFLGEEISEGTSIVLKNVMFFWDNGPCLIATETSELEVALTMEDLVVSVFGEDSVLPLPSQISFWDVFWETESETTIGTFRGVFGKAYIDDDNASTFVSTYVASLVENGYSKNKEYKDEEGDTVYVYVKDSIYVSFYAPLHYTYDDGSSYTFTLFQAFDANQPVVNEE